MSIEAELKVFLGHPQHGSDIGLCVEVNWLNSAGCVLGHRSSLSLADVVAHEAAVVCDQAGLV
jgi:hypothetical protein